ncbi:hypothetical protein SAMN05192583_3436 [Sphingomonas gellani]|uniref:Uncharacterized protein n=1 Tax=Sphingomonas gellani TaxID=1166340 RepID=A0A1H8IZ83_9SPHN|nr:hypothetical protein [Sphingomonas gellani]SEN73465.1 hypothetical protein SAMN05192583_3436 [Sphingomonas gellani]
MITLFVLSAALQAGTTPTAAPAPATAPSPTQEAAPKLRCKRQAETGSYVRATRICHTEKEWREIERGNSLEMDRFRDRTPINSARPLGS